MHANGIPVVQSAGRQGNSAVHDSITYTNNVDLLTWQKTGDRNTRTVVVLQGITSKSQIPICFRIETTLTWHSVMTATPHRRGF